MVAHERRFDHHTAGARSQPTDCSDGEKSPGRESWHRAGNVEGASAGATPAQPCKMHHHDKADGSDWDVAPVPPHYSRAAAGRRERQ